MLASRAIPDDWLRHLTAGPIGLGLDVATTANKTSNPSSLVVSQQEGKYIHERLVVSWKTSDDRVTKAVVRAVLVQLANRRKRPRALSVDSSNEKFLARQLQREFTQFCPVRLISSGETTHWKGEDLTYKVLLGNLYSSLYEDALITIPAGAWIIDDRRLVRRDKGSFSTDLGPNGEHGDTFDGGKLAYWSLCRKGRAELHAAHISDSPATPEKNTAAAKGLRNWLARKMGLKTTLQPNSAAFKG
jgi:hypothetical protein